MGGESLAAASLVPRSGKQECDQFTGLDFGRVELNESISTNRPVIARCAGHYAPNVPIIKKKQNPFLTKISCSPPPPQLKESI